MGCEGGGAPPVLWGVRGAVPALWGVRGAVPQVSTDNVTFNNIVGATATPLTGAQMGALAATRYYRAVITSGTCTSANSTTVTVTVNPTSVGGTASANQTICQGSTPANITLAGHKGTIQWQVSSDNVTFNNIAGATSSPLTGAQMGALAATRYYRAVVTSGTCSSANSTTVTVTVTPTVGTPTAITVSAGTEPTCQLTNGTTTTTYATTATDNTGFNWSLSNGAAGSINPTTGVMTWSDGFSGSVNIQVTANGCNGPSAQVIRTVNITATVGTPTAISVSAGTEPTCQLANGTTTTTYGTTATDNTGFNWSLSNAAAGSINPTTGLCTVRPYLRQCTPPEFSATLPPMVQAIWLLGSGA